MQRLWIGGTAQPGDGTPFAVIDPATGEELGTVAAAGPAQVDAAVAAASVAWPAWRDAAQDDRSGTLHRIAAAVRDHADELTDLATHETGRTRSRNSLYVEWTARIFDQYAELARVDGGRLAPGNEPGQLSLVRRVPYGTVSVLVPWNYPLLLLAFKVAPALAAGNVVVIKPAPETTLTTLLLGEILTDHLPKGAVSVLAGGGDVGEALVGHGGVDMVAFTGSTRVGRRIGAVCGELARPAHLELGGKDPAIVFDDVDPATAAAGVVWAAFLNAGQVCTSTERAYVHEDVYEAFVAASVYLAAGLRVGDPFDPKTQVGPMRSEVGRRRVLDQIAASAARGAEVFTGGDAPAGPGFYLRPTVIVGADHSHEIMREETFGPVLPVMPFGDDDEGFALAADTEYGLGASVYTASPGRAYRAQQELRVGTVWINDPVVDNLGAPFGGMRASGNARELGIEGLHAFTAARHVHWNVALEMKPWWFRHEEES